MTPARSLRSARRAHALAVRGARHTHPQDVTAAVFRDSAFFDPQDAVQVKYEMLRQVRTEPTSVAAAAAEFGFSRPAFYQARAAFTREGLPGLLPRKRGPKRPHKLSDDVLAVLAGADLDETAGSRFLALAELLMTRFGIVAHPRSIERSLARYTAPQEKKR